MTKRKRTKATPEVPSQFILWNPANTNPPHKIFTTRAEAEACAKACSIKYEATVYVCQLVAEASPPVREFVVIQHPASFRKLDA
jgi:hypothetical protein